jgi:hypothetical protein
MSKSCLLFFFIPAEGTELKAQLEKATADT